MYPSASTLPSVDELFDKVHSKVEDIIVSVSPVKVNVVSEKMKSPCRNAQAIRK